MFRFEPTTDRELIKGTIIHPKNYKYQCDEESPSPEEFVPPANVLYVAVYDDKEYLGLFCLVPYDEQTWEIHTCLLPNAWGKRALKSYQEGIRWVWSATQRTRIIGHIKEDNRLALQIAKRAGLKQVGRVGMEGKDGTTHYKAVVEVTRKWVESHKE